MSSSPVGFRPAMVVALALVAGLADLAHADCMYLPDVEVSTVLIEYFDEASIWILPDGTGRRLDQAYADGGSVVSAVVTAQLIDPMGNPMTTIEPDEIWIEDPGGGLAFCGGAWHPDAWDLENGLFYWTGTPEGGGSRPPDGSFLELRVCNMPLPASYALRYLSVNSPDINGDLEVDLSDIVLFVQDLGGPYNHRSDFVHDGVINLSDVAVMAAAIGATCP
jgi:hypothetical protein